MRSNETDLIKTIFDESLEQLFKAAKCYKTMQWPEVQNEPVEGITQVAPAQEVSQEPSGEQIIDKGLPMIISKFISSGSEEAYVLVDGEVDSSFDEYIREFVSKVFRVLYQNEIMVLGGSIESREAFEERMIGRENINMSLSFTHPETAKKTKIQVLFPSGKNGSLGVTYNKTNLRID